MNEQQGRGLISGMILRLEASSENRASIHRYNNSEDHYPFNVFLETLEINVQQNDAIECLFTAWRDLYERLINCFIEGPKTDFSYMRVVRNHYHISPKALGITGSGRGYNKAQYTRELSQWHLPSILAGMIHDHINRDIKRGIFEYPTTMTKKQFHKLVYEKSLLLLDSQKWRCSYTDVLMTIEKSWTRFSFERIDNDLPHFTQAGDLTNIVFICRLLNGNPQFSRAKILTYLLHQPMVQVPFNVRQQARSEIDQLLRKEGDEEKRLKVLGQINLIGRF